MYLPESGIESTSSVLLSECVTVGDGASILQI